MGPAAAVGVLFGSVDAEMLIEGGEHVLRRLRVGFREGPFRVRFADHAAAFYRSAGERGAEDVWIMIPAGVVVDLRRAAELAPGDDERGVKQAALVQIFDQR